jgi:uncharacterized protein YbgA (DUF1722 family)/uncharacterized protein YbbK (DUF523 family)
MTAAPSERTTALGPIRVGISACLLGEQVRFDGGHKRDTFLTETLGPFVEWVPVCPEVESGFGTPREPMRLVRTVDGVRLLTVKSGVDVTAPLADFVERRVPALAAEGLSGFVLKKDSPSCGLERVKMYGRGGMATRTGRGLFAGALIEQYPNLPVEEEGRLSDPRLRENFVERLFAYTRLRELFRRRWSVGSLVAFHTAHKLILMAHAPDSYRALGRLTASAQSLPRPELVRRYTDAFMAALRVAATRGRHTNVLQHMAGYFKRQLDRAAREELLGTIEDYRRGLVPLVVPVTLIRHHVRTHRVDYLASQLYLEPYPKELMLRLHV